MKKSTYIIKRTVRAKDIYEALLNEARGEVTDVYLEERDAVIGFDVKSHGKKKASPKV